MAEIPLNARTLSFRWDGCDWTMEVDDEQLAIEWNSRTMHRTVKVPLRNLKRRPSVERWIATSSQKRVATGMTLAAAGSVVLFSDIPRHVPLLAPALFVFGGLNLYRGYRGMLPISKTTIRNKRDSYVTAIPHFKELETRRRAFESILFQMIQQARLDDPDGN
jgi:hypothetical protein